MRRTHKYVAMTQDEAQRRPSTLLRAVSLSNGRWTFYEAINFELYKFPICANEGLKYKAKHRLTLRSNVQTAGVKAKVPRQNL